MLTEAQREARKGKIGASFGPKLMIGDEKAIALEWMRLVEHPDYKELDLSGQWGPSYGGYLEPFMLDYHEKKTGKPLTDRGVWVDHPDISYLGCTLDAYRCCDNTNLDAKVWSRWSALDECITTYPAQLIIQKSCTRAARSALLVCHGGEEPQEHEVLWTPEYEGELWRRVEWFWKHVETLQAPYKLPGVKAPLINAVKVVDMGKSNSWGKFAAQWLQNHDAKKAFDDAVKNLKDLIDEDVAKAYGHGICATRSKAGSITIKELVQ
jgi:hypothetical protein